MSSYNFHSLLHDRIHHTYHALILAARFCQLLLCHFSDVTLPHTLTEMTVSLMTLALEASLGPELCSHSQYLLLLSFLLRIHHQIASPEQV